MVPSSAHVDVQQTDRNPLSKIRIRANIGTSGKSQGKVWLPWAWREAGEKGLERRREINHRDRRTGNNHTETKRCEGFEKENVPSFCHLWKEATGCFDHEGLLVTSEKAILVEPECAREKSHNDSGFQLHLCSVPPECGDFFVPSLNQQKGWKPQLPSPHQLARGHRRQCSGRQGPPQALN